MGRGRPPKPNHIKRLEGFRGHRTAEEKKDEPIGLGSPQMPEDLPEDAQALWNVAVRSLPLGLLTAADTQCLERFASAWARYRECRRRVEAIGLLVKGSTGQPAMNPLIKIQALAAREMHQAGESLGLSPVARSRLTAPDGDQSDPLSLLLGGLPDGAYRADFRSKKTN